MTRGSSIIREGEAGNDVYIIFNGRMRIYRSGVAFADLEIGESIGELCILQQLSSIQYSSFTASALVNCSLLVLSRKVLETLICDNCSIARGVLESVTIALRRASYKVSF